MAKTIHLFILLIIFVFNIFSQVGQDWIARYNGPVNGSDKSSSIAIDGTGNIYITGGSEQNGTNQDYVTIKYNSSGIQQWISIYNGTGNDLDFASSIAIDESGNVYVTGESKGNTSDYDYATVKYNSFGVQQWAVRYNGTGNNIDQAKSIAIDGSGNIYVTGESKGNATDYDYATIKYNSAGVQQWVQRYNGLSNSFDIAISLVIDNLGNVYVTGSSNDSLTSSDYVTIKYNSVGIQQWITKYNGPGNSGDFVHSIGIDGSNNIYVTGESQDIGSDFDYATLKYNSSGVQQWVARYNGTGNLGDYANALAIDGSGNVYVTGRSAGTIPLGFTDIATVKYNSSGIQQWVSRYNYPNNSIDEQGNSIKVDDIGNVYVTGESFASGSDFDYVTIKYNSTGIEQWTIRYNGPGNGADMENVLAIDGSGNVFVTGSSLGSGTGNDFTTLKYSNTINPPSQAPNLVAPPNNSTGQSLTPLLDWDSVSASSSFRTQVSTDGFFNTTLFDTTIQNTQISIPSGRLSNNILYYWRVRASNSGGDGPWSSVWNFRTAISLVNQPVAYDKWISGEKDTIRWSGTFWPLVNIKCTLNVGSSLQSTITIAQNVSNAYQSFIWDIPDNILSFKSKVSIENSSNSNDKIESPIFRIKPYILTRINSDSTYYEYRKDRDQWGFWNDSTQLWFQDWYQQFDYQGIDPFTGSQYSQWQGNHAFENAQSNEFPDWVSWVNTFTVNKCYFSTFLNIYRKSALIKWSAAKKIWNGSCFGISISNGLAFTNKTAFLNKYTSFPQFTIPQSINATDPVRRVVNEIQTHWFGEPHQSHTRIAKNKTPKQTLLEVRNALLNDDSLRTLYIWNNGPRGGAHEIVPYKVTNVPNNSNGFNIHVYDVSFPNSLNTILIDTSHFSGDGSWEFLNWPNWGGKRGIYLEDPVETYLINPTFPVTTFENSGFVTGDSLLQIFNPIDASIFIKDQYGNITGYINDSIHINIPFSSSILIPNGKETPPYGYNLKLNSYSMKISSIKDTINAYFFTGNRSYAYDRYSGEFSQNDKIYFNDGISVSNPDSVNKTISLLSIIDEVSQEKLFKVSSIDLALNDSIKVSNPDNDKYKFTSYTTSKNYNIEIEYSTGSTVGRFGATDIILPANSSHTFVPLWANLYNSQLFILVDLGNNGTIDDTLRINNQIIGIEQQGEVIPSKFSLSQNYPNPFNPLTRVEFDIPRKGFIKLTIFDVLGQEITKLVNQDMNPGSYKIDWDASKYPSGVYFYRLEAEEFTETKKMILIK